MTDRQVVLVTGASRGFGRLVAETLSRRGCVVFAGMRDIAGRNRRAREEIEALAASGASIAAVELDVSDDAAVEAAVASVLEKEGRIDVLVNNAGHGLSGLAECSTVEQAKHLFEVHYFGAHRMCRAVLPTMRARKSGLLVHVSSIGARWPWPNIAHYCAAKAALEALGEAYRYELSPFGVDSVIVEPGAYGTGFLDNLHHGDDVARAQGYGARADAPRLGVEAVRGMIEAAKPDPQDVADAVAQLVDMPFGRRPLRTLVGKDSAAVAPLNEASDALSRAMRAMLGLP